MSIYPCCWPGGLLVLIAGVFLFGMAAHQVPATKRFQIEDNSKLYLSGTSNVNSFTCDCGDRFYTQSLEVEHQGGHAQFQHADLTMRAGKFDCHNRKIDQDMQKALRAREYPLIRIALKESWYNTQHLDRNSHEWFSVKAKVDITITKVRKEHQILAKARMLDHNRVQLRGEKALNMSDFGIEPPEALFGMIKVNDEIVFHFDLIVRIED
jgi:hypothetical protein